MEKAFFRRGLRSVRPISGVLPNSNNLITRRAVILCAVAVPVVGFNIFASSQHNETILYWSLAITLTSTLVGSAFVLWATNILWPAKADIRELQSRISG